MQRGITLLQSQRIRRILNVLMLGLLLLQSLPVLPVAASEQSKQGSPDPSTLEPTTAEQATPVTSTTDPEIKATPAITTTVTPAIRLTPTAATVPTRPLTPTVPELTPCLSVQSNVYLPTVLKNLTTSMRANAPPAQRSSAALVATCYLDVRQDTPISLALTSIVSSSAALSHTLITTPSHGSASLSATTLSYTPTQGFSGGDLLSYTFEDGGQSWQVDVHLNVSPSAVPVVPLAECVADLGGGQWLAQFGYWSYSSAAVDVPHGSSNGFSPAPSERGQPTTFSPGMHSAVFTPPFDGAPLTWTLGHYRASASSSSPICAVTPPTPTMTPTGTPATSTPTATPGSNQPPLAASGTLSVTEDIAASLDLSTLASDPDGDLLTYTLALTPTHGAASVTNSMLSYQPDANYSGPDSLRYSVSDGRGGSASGDIAITVNAVNDAPIVTLQADPVSGTLPLTVTFTAQASDIEGDALSYRWVFGDGTEATDAVSTTHVYTATGLYASYVVVSDTSSAEGSAMVQIRAGNVANYPPVADDETLFLQAISSTIDLDLLSYDVDQDPLSWAIATPPEHGTASIISSTLTYTRSEAYTGTDTLIYSVSDSINQPVTATLTIVDQRVVLAIEPNSVILTGVDVTHTLHVRGYDQQGNVVSLEGMQLDWLVSHSNWITGTSSITYTVLPDDPTTIIVRSTADAGAASFVVRDHSDATIRSQIVNVLVGQPRENTFLVPDDQLVFPAQNLTPTLPLSETTPTNPDGTLYLGAFTQDELLSRFEVISTTLENGDESLIQAKYAIVTTGPAPSVGSMLLTNESAQLFGRVLSVTQRSGYNLIQLELVELPDVFKTLDFYINSERMIDDGVYFTDTIPLVASFDSSGNAYLYERTPERLAELEGQAKDEVAPEDQAALDSLPQLQSTTPTTPSTQPWFRGAHWEKDKILGACKAEANVNWGGFSIKPNFALNPKIETGLKLGKYVDQNGNETEYIEMAKAAIGMNPTAGFAVELKFQASGDVSLSCELFKKDFTIPLAASANPILGALNAFLRPTVTVKVNFAIKAALEGGPKLALKWSISGSIDIMGGFQYENQQLTLVPPSKFDPKVDITQPSAIINGNLGIDRWKVEATAGIYIVGEFKFRLLGSVFDLLGPLPNRFPGVFRVLRAFEHFLTVDVLEAQLGFEVKTAWATPAYVLWDNVDASGGKFKPSQAFQVPFSIALKASKIKDLLKIFGLDNYFSLDLKLGPKDPIYKADWYKALDPGENYFEYSNTRTDTIWPGDALKIVSKPVEDTRWPYDWGQLYYISDTIGIVTWPVARLERQGDQLVGFWEVPESVCEGKNPGDPIVFHLLGYNHLMGVTTASYIGKIQVTCDSLRVDIILPTDITNASERRPDPNRPNDPDLTEADWPSTIPVLYACNDPNDQYDRRDWTAISRATDNQAQLQTLEFVFGGRIVKQGGPGTTHLDATLTHDFGSNNPDYHPVYAIATARRPKLDANGNPTGQYETITKEVHKPFFMIYRNCGDLRDFDHRTLNNLCEVVIQERVRIGHIVSPPGGVPIVVFPPWGDQPWYTIGRYPKGLICSWITRSDPHIATMDGLRFDSFSLGEFTYLKPRPGYEQGGVTLQARQQHVEDIVSGGPLSTIILNLADWTSWNTAFALKADGTIFEFRAGDLTKPYINHQLQPLEPGIHQFGEVDLVINSERSAELKYRGFSFRISQSWGTWIDVESTVPQDDSHYGMSGRPNGNIDDDFLLPDGRPALDAYDFANGWRVTELDESLFTYDNPGDGPWTYNMPQINEPPSREELAPFMQQAEDLLAGVCQSDSIDEVEVRNVAYELYAGRPAAEVAQTGLCFYAFHGTITNQLVPGLPVPGAKVTVTDGTQELCSTWTDRFGTYTCMAPASGALGTRTLSVSQRGSASTSVQIDALPPAGRSLPIQADLAVAPTTLRMYGTVQDQTNQPLYNAEVRTRGPVSAGFTKVYTSTNATGQYTSYLMLDDGVLTGNLTFTLSYNPDFNSTDPNAQSIVAEFVRPFSGLNEHALNQFPADLTLTGVLLRFSGRVSYQFDEAIPVEGARVLIEPTVPHPEFDACDITTLIYRDPKSVDKDHPIDLRKETTDRARVGTYACDVPLEDLTPFQANVQVLSRNGGSVITSQIVDVDPQTRPAGETFNVTTLLRVDTPVLRLRGQVTSPQGQRLAGAVINASSDDGIADALVRTDVTGVYTAYLPLNENAVNGSVSYSVGYLNVGTSGSADFIGAQTGTPLDVNKDFVVRGSLLEFAGRVIDTRTNAPVYGASVTISSPDDPLFCDMQTGLHPLVPDEYRLPPTLFDPNPRRCKLVVDGNAPQRMRLVYDVTTADDHRVYTDTLNLPAVGGYSFVSRDLLTRSITPTLLELRGSVVRPTGAPLAGASVSIDAGGASTSARTDQAGAYTTTLRLPNGVLSGTLDYSVSYRTLSITDTQPFTATQYATTAITHDLLYTPRTVFLRGTITNTYGIDLPPTTVEISSTDITTTAGSRCFTQTDTAGTYVCAAQTTTLGPITLIYKTTGMWGAQTFTETATIPANADVVDYTKDLSVNLTVLHAVGRITTPAGEPLEGVQLTPSGNDVFRVETHPTDADGNYDFYILLRTRPSDGWSGQVQYFVGYGTEGRIYRLDYSAVKNQATLLQKDFTLDMRVITFKGELLNAYVPANRNDKGVYGTRVSVTSPQIGPLCEFNSLDRYKDYKYTCSARVFSDQPFDITYLLSGDWGSATYTGTLSSVPAPGELLKIERNFSLRPPTLLLTGKALDRNNRPLTNIAVEADAPAFTSKLVGEQLKRTVGMNSDQTGRYTAYVVLDQSFTNTTIDYKATYRFDGEEYVVNDSRDIVVEGNSLQQVNVNLQFPYRKVTFKGRLRNATDPGVKLDGTLLIVSPSLDRTLCASVSASSASDYSCEALLDTDDEYLVNYRVTGIWGATNLLNQPISGTLTTVSRTLDISPRVLHLGGTVKDPNGVALANAKVRMSSYSIVNERYTTLEATTDASGVYTASAVLGDGVVQVAVRYDVSVNGNTTRVDDTFSISGSAPVVSISKDLVIDSAQLKFTGTLINALMGASGSWSGNNQLVVSSPQLGQLCTTSNLSSSFSCTANITTQSPFDVNYTIFADWGSRVLTDRVTLIPAFGAQGVWTSTLTVTPTMVHVSGTAMLSNSLGLNPIANASVRTALPGRVSSPMISSVWTANPKTTLSGTFDLYAVLREVQQPTTATLSLVFDSTYINQHIFTATADIINQTDAGTLIFYDRSEGGNPSTARTILLKGLFVNALAPNAPTAQPKAYYRLESPTLGTICAYDNPDDPPVGSYYCPVTVDNDEPFEVEVSAWGPYGAQQRTYQVTSIPPIGGQATVQEDVQFTPTTIHAAGMVFEPAVVPVPLGNVDVLLSLEQQGRKLGSTRMRTQPNGTFDLYLVLPNNVTGLVDMIYDLDLDGITAKYGLSNRQLQVGQLNEWSYLLPFEKRRVRFAGRVTNDLVPGMGVPGQVFITAPDFTTLYCDADINPATGYYSCDAQLQSSQPITVNYRINGLWGSFDRTGVVTDIAGVGSTTLVERDMGITPTTLRMYGSITDSYGEPLGNTRMQVSGEGLAYAGARGDDTVDIVTNASGQYEAFVLLRPNVTRGDLNYDLAYYNVTQSYTRAFFGMVENQLNQQLANFELDFRNVVFTGRVRNQFVPAQGLLGTLTLTSTVEGELCSAELDDGHTHQLNPDVYIGEYRCVARGVTMDSFPAQYIASGEWGSVIVSDTVPFGQAGSEISLLKNIAATPTTLRLVGSLTDGLSNPLPGSSIEVTGDGLYNGSGGAQATVDAQGLYTTTVVLKQGVVSGTLNYRVSVNSGHANLSVPYNVAPTQLTTITQSILFEDRPVNFSGFVRNGLTGQPLSGISIAVTDQGGSNLCATSSSGGSASYACTTRLLDNSSVPMRYQLSGDWGSAVISDTIPAGASNVTTNVSRTLTISPTMLRLRGTLRDGLGVPISGASIQVTGAAVSSLSGSPSLTTDSNGRYEGLLLIKADKRSDALTLLVTVGGSSGSVAVPFSAAAGQITTVNKDIIFETRAVRFHGSVINALAPGSVLRYTSLSIATASGSSLCQTSSNSAGAYDCTVQIVGNEGFNIAYTLSGDWGSTTINASVPAGASGSTIDMLRDLGAAPTTLVLRGIVRDVNSTPLSGISINVSNPSLSNLNSSPTLTTNSQGVYSTTLVLKAGATDGTLTYHLTGLSGAGDVLVPFSVAANSAVVVTKDIVFTPRTLQFTGRVYNTLAPSMTIPGMSVVVRNIDGTLCSANASSAGSYSCSRQVAEGSSFPVEYAVSGVWGSAILTGTVPTAAVSSTTTVVTRDLGLTMTTLKLQGRVIDADDSGIAGVSITINSADAIGPATATSDASGNYVAYLGLKVGTASTSLSYQAQAMYSTDNRTVALNSIADRALTPVTQNFYFTTRRIVFNATPVNYWSGETMAADSVAVSTANTGEICRDTNPGATSFSCEARIVASQSFLATYTVSGTWGVSTRQYWIYPDATTNDIIDTHNIAVQPTTLYVYGAVRDPAGYGRSGAAITVTGELLAHDYTTTSNSYGNYGMYPFITSSALSGVITLTVTLDGQTVTRPLTLTNLSANSYNQRQENVSLGLLPPTLTTTPSAFTVTMDVDSITTATLTISNTGERDLTYNAYNNNSSASPWLVFSSRSGTLTPTALITQPFQLNTTGLISGTYNAQIRINTNDPSGSYRYVPVQLHVIGTPDLALSAQQLAFGDVFVGGSQTRTLTLTNTGTVDIGLSDVSVDNPAFATTWVSGTITPSSTSAIQVRLAPTAVQPYSGTMTVTTTVGVYQIPLSGAGALPPVFNVSPTAVEASATVGTSTTVTLTISNTGSADLTWQAGAFASAASNADAFGYRWIDNTQPGGPAYTWNEIASTGSAIGGGLGDDNYAGPFDIGFPFSFYGQSYTQFYVGSNGYIGFGPPSGYESRFQTNIPNAGTPNTIIAWSWTDLNRYGDSQVYMQLMPEGLVIQFQNYGVYNGSARATAQIVLFRDGRIQLRYKQVDGGWRTHTVGIENSDGSIGQQVAYNTNYIQTGRIVELGVKPSWLDLQPNAGSVSAGQQQQVQLTLDATGLISNTYQTSMTLQSNDPLTPTVTLPVVFHVSGAAALSAAPPLLDFGSVFVGQSATRTLTITNVGSASTSVQALSSAEGSITSALSPTLLEPGQALSTTVRYSPTSAGPLSSTLDITASAGSASVALSGSAVLPPVIVVDPPSISASLTAGAQLTRTLTISNTGSADLLWNTTFASGGPGGILANLNAGYASITALIPNRYDFSEGTSGNVIGDGGGDMYDNGNYISTNLGTELPYSDNSVVASPAFGPGGSYFTRKYPGLFVLGATLDGIDQFSVTGYLGADGGGAMDASVITTQVGGSSYRGFVKRVYNAGDPSVNHLIIVADRPGLSHSYSSNTDIDDHTVSGLSGSTQIFYLLYASASGGYINDAQTEAIMREFLTVAHPSQWLQGGPNSGTVAAGSAQTVDVVLNASTLISGTYTAALTLNSNDPATPSLSVPITLTVSGSPVLSAAPDPVSFGPAYVGGSVTRTLTISNTGTADLVLQSLTSDLADFSAGAYAPTLAPGATQSITLTFAPSSAGPQTATLTIVSNAGSTTVALDGSGVLPPVIAVAPASLSASLTTGAQLTRTLTISNTGASVLTYTLEPRASASAVLDVAVLGADSGTNLNDVTAKLVATGQFNTVTGINVSQRTPALAELRAYAAVLVYSNNNFADAATLGNVLADYIDQGGGVVMMQFAHSSGPAVGGRFASGGYRLFNTGGSYNSGNVTLGHVYQPTHPLLAGVSSFATGSSGAYRSTSTLVAGTTRIVDYSDGTPLAVAKAISTPLGLRPRLDLNFYPASSSVNSGYWDASTDGGRLMANALLVVASPAYLRPTPLTGTVAPGGAVSVAVVFDAANLGAGTYQSQLDVVSNDIDTPKLSLPVTLTVE